MIQMKKKIKRLICFILCMVLVLPTSVFAQQSAADYSKHWAGKQIESFLEMGFITAGKDGNYRPNEPITRADFAVMANNAFTLIEKADASFKDVQTSDVFYNDMLIARKAGYLTGLPDGTVKPKGSMSREEYAAIIARLLKLDTSKHIAEADKYKDSASMPDWSKGAIGAVVKYGYMQGEPGNAFNPKGLVTRGQAVAVLERCYRNVVKTAYNKPGTYTGNTIEGNAAINVKDVTLENATIAGNLIIGEGVGNGNIRLKNVVVKGETIVKGGGLNSIIIEDSELKNIIIVKEDNKVRVVAVGKTTIERVDMQSGGKLEEQGTTGNGFRLVTIAEGLNSNEPVILKGNFESVQVQADGVKLDVESGSIAKLDVAKTAGDARINLGAEVKVTELVVQAESEITGSGTITTADVKVQGVVVTAPTTTIKAAAGITVGTSIPGQAPASTPAPAASTGGRSGGGSGGGGSSRDDDDDDNRVTTVAVTGVTLNHTTMTLTAGGAAGTLTATVVPANATNKNVAWSSGNTAVATVANGVVTPVAAGTAVVTATTLRGAKTATCTVTVNAAEPESLAVIYTQFEEEGQDIAVTANYHHHTTVSEAVYSDTQIISDTDVTFELISKPAEASSWGTPVTVSLTADEPASLAELLAGEAGISYEQLRDMADTDYAIDFTQIAGELADEYAGTVVITLTALAGDLYDAYEEAEEIGTGSASASFNVGPVAVTGIELSQYSLSLAVGGSPVELEATVIPSDAENKNVTWSSSDTSIATVAGGVVTPVGEGQATIRVTTTDGGYVASCLVTVSGEPTGVDFKPDQRAAFKDFENEFSFNVNGILTGEIDTSKLKYMTAQDGEHYLGAYEKVDYMSILQPGQYYYSGVDSQTAVRIKLTDADAAAIKGLEGFATDDSLLAESGWYPNAAVGAKEVAVINIVPVNNGSTHNIESVHFFNSANAEIGYDYAYLSAGSWSMLTVDKLTANIIFYVGTYNYGETPTSGKMRIVPVTEDVIEWGITLDDSGWIDVTEDNFGPGASEGPEVPLSSDATLSIVTVNEMALPGFDPAVLVYSVELPEGTTAVPEVAATAKDAAAEISIDPAESLEGTIYILVTAEDGTTKTYEISFTVAEPIEEPVGSFILDRIQITNDPYSEPELFANNDLIWVTVFVTGEGDFSTIDYNDFIVQVGNQTFIGEESYEVPSDGHFNVMMSPSNPDIGFLQIKSATPFENMNQYPFPKFTDVTITGQNKLSESATARFYME